MTASTALVPGVRRHPAGPGYQVRIRPFSAETFPTPDQANSRAIELRRMKAAGIRSATRNATLTLAEPLTAGVLGAVVLAEPMAGESVAGAGLVLAGLLVLAFPLPSARVAPAPA